MEIERFHQLVARLERESRQSAGSYRAKVAALAVLGFGVLALVLALAGFGIVLLVGFAIALIYTGGGALLLLLKLGKLLVLLALPLWFLIRSSLRALFVRLPAPQGAELSRAQAPALFAAMDGMRQRMQGPRFHHVLVVDEVNAAVMQRPAFGLFGWPRNYLLLGLPLLESLPAEEALAVVAHEYGHLAGAHGRFEAFIYRLRRSWATLDAHAGQWQGWAGRPLRRLVGWYAPYFNAYTFVLARANEYQADRASAELVGSPAAAHALKRINLVAPRYEAFLESTFKRIADEPVPPRDLLLRWADAAAQPAAAPDAQRWLADALDREGAALDTHPVLRARLSALPGEAARLDALPPERQGASAAETWLGALLPALRERFAQAWAERVAEPWAERHQRTLQQRQRLAALRALAAPDAEEALEALHLQRLLDPQADLREALASYNAAHPDRAWALFLEGCARLDRDDAGGLRLLERAIALDADTTQAGCEAAWAFLKSRKDAAAETWAERWQQRQAFEARREQELRRLNTEHTLVAAELDAETLAAVRERLTPALLADVAAVYLVRRVLPTDPSLRTYVLAVRLTRWAALRRRHLQVRDRLAALEWPLPHLMVLPFSRPLGKYCARIKAVPGALLR